MNLNAEEIEIIEEHRLRAYRLEKSRETADVIIRLTSEYQAFFNETGEYITFSTFIDNFEVETRIPEYINNPVGRKTLYEAIKAILYSTENTAKKYAECLDRPKQA